MKIKPNQTFQIPFPLELNSGQKREERRKKGRGRFKDSRERTRAKGKKEGGGSLAFNHHPGQNVVTGFIVPRPLLTSRNIIASSLGNARVRKAGGVQLGATAAS